MMLDDAVTEQVDFHADSVLIRREALERLKADRRSLLTILAAVPDETLSLVLLRLGPSDSAAAIAVRHEQLARRSAEFEADLKRRFGRV